MTRFLILMVAVATSFCSPIPAPAAEPSAFKSAVVHYAESFYEMPKPVLSEVWNEESSRGLDERDHDRGQGCGDFGMKTETASLMLGRDVLCGELKDNFFRAAFLAAEYLWGEAWCGRYRTMELRVLCYRTGVHSSAVAEWGNRSWRRMPKDYGTRWIMQRLHDGEVRSNRIALVARQRTFARN